MPLSLMKYFLNSNLNHVFCGILTWVFTELNKLSSIFNLLSSFFFKIMIEYCILLDDFSAYNRIIMWDFPHFVNMLNYTDRFFNVEMFLQLCDIAYLTIG